MPQRDRAAVDVEALRIDLQRVGAGQDLSGEGLVDLHEIDVGHREPRAPQRRA